MREHGITTASYDITGDLEFITMYTLFDITRTGVLKNYTENLPAFLDDADQLVRNRAEWNRSRNQQRNFETLMQIVSLRAQPIMLENPTTITVDNAVSYSLGSAFSGAHTIWIVSFAVEHTSVYSTATHELGQLIAECHQVPMIAGLNETAQLQPSVLLTQGINTNIVFKINKRINTQYVTH